MDFALNLCAAFNGNYKIDIKYFFVNNMDKASFACLQSAEPFLPAWDSEFLGEESC